MGPFFFPFPYLLIPLLRTYSSVDYTQKACMYSVNPLRQWCSGYYVRVLAARPATSKVLNEWDDISVRLHLLLLVACERTPQGLRQTWLQGDKCIRVHGKALPARGSLPMVCSSVGGSRQTRPRRESPWWYPVVPGTRTKKKEKKVISSTAVCYFSSNLQVFPSSHTQKDEKCHDSTTKCLEAGVCTVSTLADTGDLGWGLGID